VLQENVRVSHSCDITCAKSDYIPDTHTAGECRLIDIVKLQQLHGVYVVYADARSKQRHLANGFEAFIYWRDTLMRGTSIPDKCTRCIKKYTNI